VGEGRVSNKQEQACNGESDYNGKESSHGSTVVESL
jgi:hypothetical protein